MNELKALADDPWNPQPKAWFERRFKDARPVHCVPMAEALTASQMALLTQVGYRPEKKECFKNATLLVDYAHFYGFEKEVRYVEGLTLDPALALHVSIEHAWVRVGDKYIDPTVERCLKADVTKWEYVALIEKDWKGLLEVLNETECYGDVYRHEFIKSLTK